MKPLELKALQARLGMSEQAFANYLGVSPSGLRKWINGTRAPTGPAERLVRLLARVAADAPEFHAHLVSEAMAGETGAPAPAAPDEPADPAPGEIPAWLRMAI